MLRPKLSSIKQLRFHNVVDRTVNPDAFIVQSNFFVKNAPKMTNLWIDSNYLNVEIRFADSDSASGLATRFIGIPPSTKLKVLFLRNVHLGESSVEDVAATDFTSLQVLKLRQCHRITTFLTSLTAALAEKGSKLAVLEVFLDSTQGTSSTSELMAVQTLVSSVTGLRTLMVDANKCQLVSKESIICQSGSLRSLGMTSGRNEYFPVANMQEILGACPLLEQLAINGPPASLGRVQDLELEWSLELDEEKHNVKTELHAMLVSTPS